MRSPHNTREVVLRNTTPAATTQSRIVPDAQLIKPLASERRSST